MATYWLGDGIQSTRRGNCYILKVQCSFTKWVEAFTIPNQRATTCAKVCLRNWICRFGVPDSIHSDQGSNFESKVFEEMCRMLEIHKTRSTAYHPEGNGQVENIQKTLKTRIPRAGMNTRTIAWWLTIAEFVDDLLENLETAYWDVRQNLKVAQWRQKDAYDKGVKHTDYQAGNFVLRMLS